MNRKKTFYGILLFLLVPFAMFNTSAEEDMEEFVQQGKQLFEQECQQCHAIGSEVLGPDLQSVTERLEEDWLIRFIRNSQELIQEGDDYAVEIFEEYNQMVMPAVDLSDDEIRSILAYIEEESQAADETDDDDAPATADATDREAAAPAQDIDTTWMNRFIYGIVILLVLIFFITFSILINLLRVRGKEVDTNPDNWINWQKINAYLMPAFLIIGFGLIIYELAIHNQYIVFPNMPSASAHGGPIDNLFIATLIITGIVFVVTQIMLFYFAYAYRYKENKKAYFYPENNKLEIFWTTIPAIVLATLVLFGYDSWRSITYEKERDEELPKVEVLGEQFSWSFRYPGESGELGRTDHLLFEENGMGLDFEDEHARDDIVTRELKLPVDQEVILQFRSKDVLHSAHMPHFRLQMYTTPGMPSQFRFTPTITTEEMREKTGNENFEYDLACNQICGTAHYNMRSVVTIVEEDEYEEWLNEQQTYYERRQ